jgi:arylsulfatase A-like enzyme
LKSLHILAAFLVLSLAACEREKPAQHYNVLLISLDTLRADHLGAYGYERDVSPRIDRFAERAVRFERAHSQAPWTTPAHAAMLTSLYPTVMGLKKYPEVGRIADRVETMAEFFQAQGYLTHAVTEGGMVHAQFGFAQGFDYYFQSARHVDHGVEKSFEWMDEHGDKPFFFFYHTYDIHRYNPPEEYRKLFVQAENPRLPEGEALSKQLQLYENEEFVKSLNAEDLEYIINLYDATIRWVDHYIGTFLDYLERRGLAEKTIVVITSDHGEEFLERNRTGHGYSNFEEQIHVPLMIYHPEVKPGVRRSLFRHIDLLPTLADALGFERRPEWLGESLWPVVAKGDEAVNFKRTVSYCECGHSNYRSVQSSRWKLIDHTAPKRTWLYDLENDPEERTPVGEEYAAVKRQLANVLEMIEVTNQKLRPRFQGEGVSAEDLPEELLEELRRLGYIK